jgi:two-component system response regulator YesN
MDRRVQQVILLMEEDIRKSLTLEEWAQIVNLSPSHLYHLFKSETGETPSRYLKTLRMQRAKELLETTFLTVKEIVTATGISDGSHFVRDFKKQYTMTPTQYRHALCDTSNAFSHRGARTGKRVRLVDSGNSKHITESAKK